MISDLYQKKHRTLFSKGDRNLMFHFLKGKSKENVLYAPCKGKVVPLSEVPDPTFSEKILGDGFAVIPSEGKIYAPTDGEIAMVFDTLHAITLTSSSVFQSASRMPEGISRWSCPRFPAAGSSRGFRRWL